MSTDAENILRVLTSQDFADWYNKGRFDGYITGSEPPVSKPEILEDIQKMFKLPPERNRYFEGDEIVCPECTQKLYLTNDGAHQLNGGECGDDEEPPTLAEYCSKNYGHLAPAEKALPVTIKKRTIKKG